MRWRSFTPSRTLNESGFQVLGLRAMDFMMLVCTLSVLQPVFHLVFGLSLLWPLILVISMATQLIIVRRKYRRHFIRDFMKFAYFKILRRGVRHDA